MANLRYAMKVAAPCLAMMLVVATLAASGAKEVSVATTTAANKVHRVVLQVNSAEPGTMNLALNNATNVEQYYRERGEKVEIEVVAFGAGLHMLRDDTSPVKDRLKAITEKIPSIS